MNTDNIPAYFGEFLKKTRVEKGFSQESLALKTGLDRTYISLLERAKRQPTLKTFFILSQAVEVPAEKVVQQIIEIGHSHENCQN